MFAVCTRISVHKKRFCWQKGAVLQLKICMQWILLKHIGLSDRFVSEKWRPEKRSRVTTQIWVAPLIGRTAWEIYPDLGSFTLSVWNVCMQSFLGRQRTSCSVECHCSQRSSRKRPTCLGILGGHVWSARLFVLLLAIKLIAGARIDTVG